MKTTHGADIEVKLDTFAFGDEVGITFRDGSVPAYRVHVAIKDVPELIDMLRAAAVDAALKRLDDLATKLHITEQLDETVLNTSDEVATQANNDGPHGQIEFLLKNGWTEKNVEEQLSTLHDGRCATHHE